MIIERMDEKRTIRTEMIGILGSCKWTCSKVAFIRWQTNGFQQTKNESRQKYSTVSFKLHFHVTNLLVRVHHRSLVSMNWARQDLCQIHCWSSLFGLISTVNRTQSLKESLFDFFQGFDCFTKKCVLVSPWLRAFNVARRGRPVSLDEGGGRVLIRAGRVLEPRPSREWIQTPSSDSHGTITRFSTPESHVQYPCLTRSDLHEGNSGYQQRYFSRLHRTCRLYLRRLLREEFDGVDQWCLHHVWSDRNSAPVWSCSRHRHHWDSLWRVAYDWCSSNSYVRVWSPSIDQWDFPEVHIESGLREVSHLICFSHVRLSAAQWDEHWKSGEGRCLTSRWSPFKLNGIESTGRSNDGNMEFASRSLRDRRMSLSDGCIGRMWTTIDWSFGYVWRTSSISDSSIRSTLIFSWVSNRRRKCELPWRSSVR